ncbi:hypothetical protein [Mycobacterium attenuatum]|uniref:hypothetical protein n=1 Tax=Mycobacterium attenuatum TaxID=2341086 RepID=UPI0010A97A84|nr:hypothetical protein [Mycobacterium attenuatum]
MQLDVSRAGIDQEFVNLPVVRYSRRSLALSLNQRCQDGVHPGGVHGQQHRVITEVELSCQFGTNYGHRRHVFSGAAEAGQRTPVSFRITFILDQTTATNSEKLFIEPIVRPASPWWPAPQRFGCPLRMALCFTQ